MHQTDDKEVVVECCQCGHRFMTGRDCRFTDCPSCGRLFDLTKVDPVFLSGIIQAVMLASLCQ